MQKVTALPSPATYIQKVTAIPFLIHMQKVTAIPFLTHMQKVTTITFLQYVWARKGWRGCHFRFSACLTL